MRGPASYCGLVGIKPTYGRVSQRGLLGTSFDGDHIGPLTRTALDNALVLHVIAGHDPLDPTTVPVPVPDFAADAGKGLSGLKVGVPANYYFDVVDPEVESAVRRAIASLEELGAEVREVRLETLQHADLLRVASSAEGYVVHEPYMTDHRDEFTPELLHRYLAAGFIRAADYIKALKLQRLVQEDFARTLREVDFLATPTNPTAAPRIGAQMATVGIRNTSISNATGLPTMSVPCGFTSAGLPIGLQLIGRPFEETLLYRVASLYGQVSPNSGRLPPIAAGQAGSGAVTAP